MSALVRLWRVLSFAGYFAWEFLLANAEVLWEIVRPRPHATPALVEVPLPGRSTLEVVSLANLITLTPGTLTVEVAEDPPTLYVHGMFVRDPESFVADLHRLEARLLAALRPVRSARSAQSAPPAEPPRPAAGREGGR